MQQRTSMTGGALLVFASLVLGGCLTPRQQAQLDVFPRNRVFQPGSISPLGPEQTSHLGEYDNGGGQNICLLQLAAGARLQKRYHSASDVTLVVVRGRGVVEVETTRYRVEPGSAVLLPHLTAYAVLPDAGDEEFDALLICSPPFDGSDVLVEK
jgi:mannose-6-phosphate isomerase-like protein (cupin superfamily)